MVQVSSVVKVDLSQWVYVNAVGAYPGYSRQVCMKEPLGRSFDALYESLTRWEEFLVAMTREVE